MGICKKVMLFTIVALANIMDMQVIGSDLLKTTVIFVFIANRKLSIIENPLEKGAPIPQKLKDVFARIKDRVEKIPMILKRCDPVPIKERRMPYDS